MNLLRWAIGFLIISSLLIFSTAVFSDEKRYEKLQIFSKVMALVQQYYVEKVDVEKLIYGGIKGMLAELDPHTNFLPPKILKEFEDETSGEFGGIGIEITVQNEALTIISPIEDTPAWKAGIKAGDKVYFINGESTKGFSLAEAAQKMQGKIGQTIRLGVMREGFERPQEFVITRAVVKIKSVKYQDLSEGYLYTRITSFAERTTDEMKAAIKEFEKKNGTLKGLLIDLRNNPGGLLNQAAGISQLFLSTGVIVSTMGRNTEKDVIEAKSSNARTDFPIVILINEYSASASEIVAGALQDNSRALVVGKRSFGKGSVQSIVKLGDGSGLKLTIARYYTPSGKSIQALGITPDVIIEEYQPDLLEKALVLKKVRREKDMKGHLIGDLEKRKQLGTEDEDADDDDDFPAVAKTAALTKVDKIASAKEDPLKKDHQLQQAISYLKVSHKFRSKINKATTTGPVTK